jgi:hypothetical protein
MLVCSASGVPWVPPIRPTSPTPLRPTATPSTAPCACRDGPPVVAALGWTTRHRAAGCCSRPPAARAHAPAGPCPPAAHPPWPEGPRPAARPGAAVRPCLPSCTETPAGCGRRGCAFVPLRAQARPRPARPQRRPPTPMPSPHEEHPWHSKFVPWSCPP